MRVHRLAFNIRFAKHVAVESHWYCHSLADNRGERFGHWHRLDNCFRKRADDISQLDGVADSRIEPLGYGYNDSDGHAYRDSFSLGRRQCLVLVYCDSHRLVEPDGDSEFGIQRL